MKRGLLLAGAFSLLLGLTAFSQIKKDKTIVVVGSSTADGWGASDYESSFVGKLSAEFSKNKHDGIDTTVILLAAPGYTTYKAMPDDFVIPANRSGVTIDKSRNITKALSYNPDVVIINFPSNDQDPKYGYAVSETMDNLRLMYNRVVQAKANCFISTSQPRDDYSKPVRLLLKQLADSVEDTFGDYALDFWDVLVTNDGQYNRKSEVQYTDAIHINDLGHELLFETILAKNIFAPQAALPVILTDFNSRLNNHAIEITWRVELEEPFTSYEVQRSANGTDFITVSRLQGTAGRDQGMDYSWTDPAPLNGKNFYRLKIIEPEGNHYSYITSCSTTTGREELAINKAYISRSEVVVELQNPDKQQVSLSVFDQSGKLMRSGQYLPDNNAQLRIPFGNALPGMYILRVLTADGKSHVKQLVKVY